MCRRSDRGLPQINGSGGSDWDWCNPKCILIHTDAIVVPLQSSASRKIRHQPAACCVITSGNAYCPFFDRRKPRHGKYVYSRERDEMICIPSESLEELRDISGIHSTNRLSFGFRVLCVSIFSWSVNVQICFQLIRKRKELCECRTASDSHFDREGFTHRIKISFETSHSNETIL